MPGRNFSLKDYETYRRRVGEATYVDCTRRADPARISAIWHNCASLCETYGPPWVVQLWTKDPQGLLDRGGKLIENLIGWGTTVTCQLTVTGLAGTPLEKHVPPGPFTRAEPLIDLLGGPDHVTWRFDPIVPGLKNLERFRSLLPQAASLGLRRLVINFLCEVGVYRRADRRLQQILPWWKEGLPGIASTWRRDTAEAIVSEAQQAGFTVRACAESKDLSRCIPGLEVPCCGDHAWFCRLSGKSFTAPPGRGSRPGCGCTPYFDVGSYGFWPSCHRCAYCYAG